ncbi:MAG: putative quinol monooxygenase [Bacteroidales bacterium]
MITITAKCVLLEDKKEEFIKTAQKLIEESNKEEGCISYNLYEDIHYKNLVSFIEVWESAKAIELHNNSAHFKSIVPKLRELQIEDSTVNLYRKL